MKSFILAHDIGTSGDKATLFSDSGELVASSFSAYEVYYPHAGWAEQDPSDYWSAFCRSTRDILAGGFCTPPQIAVIAFSGQMQAALAVDAAGEPLGRSLIWADQRSIREQRELASRMSSDRVYDITGHRLNSSYSATKIMWLRRNAPDLYARTAKFLHAKDFLAMTLTGSFSTDYSDATGMNLLDIRTFEWSREILDAAGISPALLPELHESTDIVGTVQRDAADATGLAEGTPVVIGGGDGACATAGAGVMKAGEAYICLGTSTWMATASTHPVIDPQRRTTIFAHFRRGLYFLCGSMQSGGGAFKWFSEAFPGKGESSGDRYTELAERAGEVPPGAENLLFLPYLIGERAPVWNPSARACFIGLSMVHDEAHLARAVMEGVALHLKSIAAAFYDSGLTFPFFRMLGGAVRNSLWLEILADVLETPVAPVLNADNATSIGAAIAGGVGVGLFGSLEEAAHLVTAGSAVNPRRENFAVYRRLYPAFQRSYDALVPVFESLTTE
ncbi:MAG TPA: FGGY-family carbohydrate kinase [Spirochaetia bacterium]|nr:FGGY-family carbohydrate kinase [Spirochaetia bacterium]